MNIYCCGCERDVQPRLTSGAEVYPHRSDLASLPFWICDDCGNWVGCHHKTKERTKPLGVIPTQQIKDARRMVHNHLDPLWQSGEHKRHRIYAFLSKKLGRQYHTADIRSVDEADQIVAWLAAFAGQEEQEGGE